MKRSYLRYISMFIVSLFILNIFPCIPLYAIEPGTGPMVGGEEPRISIWVWVAAAGFAGLALFQSIRDAYKKKEEKPEEKKPEYILIPLNTDQPNSEATDKDKEKKPENTDENNNNSDK